MKKLVFVLVAGLMFSCNGSSEAHKSKDAESAPKAAEATSTAEVGKVQHIGKAEYLKNIYNFEANPNAYKYNGQLPAIVDFYADWCGPCKRVAPILDKLAAKYAGKIIIYKVNVDNEQELAAAHGIQSIPTMIFYPVDGQPQMVQGALPEEALEEAIAKVLLKK